MKYHTVANNQERCPFDIVINPRESRSASLSQPSSVSREIPARSLRAARQTGEDGTRRGGHGGYRKNGKVRMRTRGDRTGQDDGGVGGRRARMKTIGVDGTSVLGRGAFEQSNGSTSEGEVVATRPYSSRSRGRFEPGSEGMGTGLSDGQSTGRVDGDAARQGLGVLKDDSSAGIRTSDGRSSNGDTSRVQDNGAKISNGDSYGAGLMREPDLDVRISGRTNSRDRGRIGGMDDTDESEPITTQDRGRSSKGSYIVTINVCVQ